MIKTITLDLDDTLWPIGPVIVRAEQRLQDWYLEHYPRIVKNVSAATVDEIRNAVLERYRERTWDIGFLRRVAMANVAAVAGYDEFDLDAAFAEFDKARNTVDLFPDVRPMLQKLRQHYALVALTNGNASLEKIGISDLFDAYICARDIRASKPDGEIFAAAVVAGGASAAETLHVGDHPLMDVDGARAAGLKAVWLNRDRSAWPRELQPPAGTIENLYQLDDLLRERREQGG